MSDYDAAVSCDRLTRHFDDLVAVDALDLQVQAGEVFGFLGHNGAGKTTTVRLLNGILTPTGGGATVLGLDPLADGPALRRQTGVLTETPSLDDRLTAVETLAIYGKLYGASPEQLDNRIPALLEEFELSDRRDEFVGTFSKGMRQRLALARTLIHEPRLLFLDEPTGGLDPVGRRHVHELIQRLSQRGGRTVFLCTHDLMEAQKLCDRVGVMEQGRLVALGTPEALARELQHGVRLTIALADAPDDGLSDKLHQPERGWEFAWDGENHTAWVRLPTREEIPEIIATLVGAGARIYAVTQQEPTLEDVYFALHEERKSGLTRSLGGQDR